MKTPLSPGNVANILKMTLKTVYKLLNAGVIPARKIGGNWYIDQDNFENFLKATPKVQKVVRGSIDRHGLT